MTEEAVNFSCGGAGLVGIVHRPDRPKNRGILMVVGGGPQYRVGGHRQLTLWSRRICAEGFPVMRFDYRGMGDAYGTFQGFEHVDDDIRAALDRFTAEFPQLEEVILWGECDAASAILFYAYRDKRVKGAVLLNPWVRTEAGEAKAILRYYYLHRLMQPSFWKKVLSLRFNPLDAVRSALRLLNQSRTQSSASRSTSPSSSVMDVPIPHNLPLPERLLEGMTRLRGPVMLVLSGRDLIAREFDVLVNQSDTWKRQFSEKPVTRHDYPDSDHTFSSDAQRRAVVEHALTWLRTW